MTGSGGNWGGATIGQIRDLGAVEGAAVLALRLWAEGPDGRDRLQAGLCLTLGAAAGARSFADFSDLCGQCLIHGRRPLMRHEPACPCLGADEACFAHLVAAASEGAREDAALIATLIVRPDMALILADLAARVGRDLRRMALRAAAPAWN